MSGDETLVRPATNPDEPFTPKIVHGLVRQALGGWERGPGSRSEQIKILAERLNWLKGYAKYRSTILPKETATIHRIQAAIASLIEDLPKIREEYVVTLEGTERHSLDATNNDVRLRLLDAVPKAKAHLDALDALAAAAQTAAELGLPFWPYALVFGHPVDRWTRAARGSWTGAARVLMEMFKLATSGSNEASYRFVQAVIPGITGETPALEAVRTELKRKRDKSRGKPKT